VGTTGLGDDGGHLLDLLLGAEEGSELFNEKRDKEGKWTLVSRW
jgi:hypothetical protein